MTAGHLVLVALALATAAAGATWFLWRVRTFAGFAAGAAGAAVMFLDDTLGVLGLAALVATAVGCGFALRTVGRVGDDGSVATWAGRFGAAWLVLAFPAAVTWASLLAAHWMLHRS